MPECISQIVFACCLVAVPAVANAQRAGGAPPDGAPVKPAGFEAIKPVEAPRGFDSGTAEKPAGDSKSKSGDANRNRRRGAEPSTRSRARQYARSLIRRYDDNKNGRLERGEWSRIRGNPAKSDANKDGVLTVDEIANRVADRPPGSQSGRPNPSTGKPPAKKKSADKSKAAGSRERSSYRFTPATERLPEGLPGWFKRRDKDRDGQVAMHEYASRWSDRTVGEFNRYDKDGDGLITPAEAKRR